VEAAETQTWLEIAVECGYLARDPAQELLQMYEYIIGKLVNMIRKPSPWILPKPESHTIRDQETYYD
jgi:hypothetical protein